MDLADGTQDLQTMKTKLIQGDCLIEMANLTDKSVDLILTDPPYFKVKDDAWDRQWEKSSEFLDWLDLIAEQWARILKPNGSLFCFASPQMAARVECLIAKRFNVMNQIVWCKPEATGRHMMMRKEDLRGFFPNSERIIFAEHHGADNMAKGEAGYAAKCDELRGFIFEPLRSYLASERDKAGLTTRMVVEAIKCSTSDHYFRSTQWALPTEENYTKLRNLFNSNGGSFLNIEYVEIKNQYEKLRKDYEELRKDYEELRRPFSVSRDVQFTDIWKFGTVSRYKGKHPCEKPQDLLRHAISSTTRPGATVLDCFMGSGSTGVACRELGREFIGIELDKDYFDKASKRIHEQSLLDTP